MKHDWKLVRTRVRRGAPGWVLLGTDLPYTTAETIRQRQVRLLHGVEVRTRNTRYDAQGKRFCDIWLREEDQ